MNKNSFRIPYNESDAVLYYCMPQDDVATISCGMHRNRNDAAYF